MTFKKGDRVELTKGTAFGDNFSGLLKVGMPGVVVVPYRTPGVDLGRKFRGNGHDLDEALPEDTGLWFDSNELKLVKSRARRTRKAK